MGAAKEKFEKDMAAFLAAGAEKRKAKEGKKQKDPNAPKKPVGGAYGQFLAEKRPEFMKKCAGQPTTAVSMMAGEEWKKLSDAQKKPYEKKYAEVLTEYQKAWVEYKKSTPDAGEAEEEEEEEEEEATPKKKAHKAGA